MTDLDDRREQLAGAPVRIVRRADAHRGAILFYHGLGVADARALHAALQPSYAMAPDRLAYVEFEDAEHFMPEEQWDQLWHNVVRWFIRFVPDR